MRFNSDANEPSVWFWYLVGLLLLRCLFRKKKCYIHFLLSLYLVLTEKKTNKFSIQNITL